MINRAKCKLCKSIVESHLPDEVVFCRCGEIAVCDGPAMRMLPLDSPHFVRIDDMGNEVVVKYITGKDGQKDEQSPYDEKRQISVEEAIEALKRSIAYNEELPDHERYAFVTGAEMNEYLKSILNIIRLIC